MNLRDEDYSDSDDEDDEDVQLDHPVEHTDLMADSEVDMKLAAEYESLVFNSRRPKALTYL